MTSRTDAMVRELHPSLANVAPLTDDYLKDSAHSMDVNMSRLSRQQMQHEMEHEIMTEKGSAIAMATVFQLPQASKGVRPVNF